MKVKIIIDPLSGNPIFTTEWQAYSIKYKDVVGAREPKNEMVYIDGSVPELRMTISEPETKWEMF